MTGARPCECGAPSECSAVWYEALAAEQLDPAMGVWHTPLVCAFYLQHHSVYRPRFADGQYRFLRLFVDRGIEAVQVAARKSVARNRGSAPTVLPEELARYEGLPRRGFPAAFEVSVHVLRDDLGGFVSRGHGAYGDRMRAWAQATIDGWQGRSGAP